MTELILTRKTDAAVLRAYAFDTAERKLDTKKRTIDVIASTEAEDGHGTVIQQDWQLERYLLNSIVYFEHNQAVGDGFFTSGGERPADKIPIAHAENVRVEDNKLKATFVFPKQGEDELSDRVWNAIQSKRLNGVSVGFIPGKVEREEIPGSDGRTRYRLSRCILFEISIVGVPSNPECVVERSMVERFLTNPKAFERVLAERDQQTSVDTTATAPKASTESVMFLNIMAKKLGCTADEASIVEAIDKLSVSARAALSASLISGADDLEKQLKDATTRTASLETELVTVRGESKALMMRAAIAIATISALGLPETSGEAEVTKSIAGLTARAAKADELEPKVKDLTERQAKYDEAEANREVEFLISRGKDYGDAHDEKSRKALHAYRKADPKGFAEDHKAALDGLRKFDDPKLFQTITDKRGDGEGGKGAAGVETIANRASADEDDSDARIAAYMKKNADKGTPITESEAIDAVLRNLDR